MTLFKFFKNKILPIGLVILLVFIATLLFYKPSRESAKSSADIISKPIRKVLQPKPEPSPFPFQEMTIPYLKARDYQSSLGNLEEISTNSNYTSYLTSYDSDGLRVNSQLTVPAGEPPQEGWPAVIFIHGYIPPTTYQTLGNYSDYVDYLAKRGLVVFKIDLRGHAQSEGEASGAYYSEDYVVDTLNAFSALQGYDLVDANRIGLWGHSMAGNVVMRAMAANPDIPRVVIWAGAVYSYEDFQEYGISDNSYRPPESTSDRRRRRQELFDTYGEFSPDSWFWQQVPATNFLDEIRGEIQVHHAVNDAVVDINYSRNLMDILDSTDIPHQLFEYQTGGHNISSPSFNTAMERTAVFFTK